MLVDPVLVPPPRAGREAPHRRRVRPFRVASRDDAPHGTLPHGRAGSPARAAPVLLIVDDDPVMTDLLPRTLRKALTSEIEIVTASTPEEAARVLREVRPDIVLSDYNLRAAKTGLDVLADAAGVAPASVRILFSGHTESEIGPSMAEVPIHAFLEKPFRLADLVDPFTRAVREACGLDLRRGAPEGR